MDLVIAVALCNCAISIGCFAVTLWAMGVRRQAIAVSNCCDRWSIDCELILTKAPASISASTANIQHLRQIYRQQLSTIDRLSTMGLWLQIFRSVMLKRR